MQLRSFITTQRKRKRKKKEERKTKRTFMSFGLERLETQRSLRLHNIHGWGFIAVIRIQGNPRHPTHQLLRQLVVVASIVLQRNHHLPNSIRQQRFRSRASDRRRTADLVDKFKSDREDHRILGLKHPRFSLFFLRLCLFCISSSLS